MLDLWSRFWDRPAGFDQIDPKMAIIRSRIVEPHPSDDERAPRDEGRGSFPFGRSDSPMGDQALATPG